MNNNQNNNPANNQGVPNNTTGQYHIIDISQGSSNILHTGELAPLIINGIVRKDNTVAQMPIMRKLFDFKQQTFDNIRVFENSKEIKTQKKSQEESQEKSEAKIVTASKIINGKDIIVQSIIQIAQLAIQTDAPFWRYSDVVLIIPTTIKFENGDISNLMVMKYNVGTSSTDFNLGENAPDENYDIDSTNSLVNSPKRIAYVINTASRSPTIAGSGSYKEVMQINSSANPSKNGQYLFYNYIDVENAIGGQIKAPRLLSYYEQPILATINGEKKYYKMNITKATPDVVIKNKSSDGSFDYWALLAMYNSKTTQLPKQLAITASAVVEYSDGSICVHYFDGGFFFTSNEYYVDERYLNEASYPTTYNASSLWWEVIPEWNDDEKKIVTLGYPLIRKTSLNVIQMMAVGENLTIIHTNGILKAKIVPDNDGFPDIQFIPNPSHQSNPQIQPHAEYIDNNCYYVARNGQLQILATNSDFKAVGLSYGAIPTTPLLKDLVATNKDGDEKLVKTNTINPISILGEMHANIGTEKLVNLQKVSKEVNSVKFSFLRANESQNIEQGGYLIKRQCAINSSSIDGKYIGIGSNICMAANLYDDDVTFNAFNQDFFTPMLLHLPFEYFVGSETISMINKILITAKSTLLQNEQQYVRVGSILIEDQASYDDYLENAFNDDWWRDKKYIKEFKIMKQASNTLYTLEYEVNRAIKAFSCILRFGSFGGEKDIDKIEIHNIIFTVKK